MNENTVMTALKNTHEVELQSSDTVSSRMLFMNSLKFESHYLSSIKFLKQELKDSEMIDSGSIKNEPHSLSADKNIIIKEWLQSVVTQSTLSNMLSY